MAPNWSARPRLLRFQGSMGRQAADPTDHAKRTSRAQFCCDPHRCYDGIAIVLTWHGGTMPFAAAFARRVFGINEAADKSCCVRSFRRLRGRPRLTAGSSAWCLTFSCLLLWQVTTQCKFKSVEDLLALFIIVGVIALVLIVWHCVQR